MITAMLVWVVTAQTVVGLMCGVVGHVPDTQEWVDENIDWFCLSCTLECDLVY